MIQLNPPDCAVGLADVAFGQVKLLIPSRKHKAAEHIVQVLWKRFVEGFLLQQKDFNSLLGVVPCQLNST